MYQKILCPVDGSEHATRALKQAIDLAKLTGAQLLILTVFRHHSLLDASLSTRDVDDTETVDDVMRDHAIGVGNAAKALAAESGLGDLRTVVKRGQPARTILSFASENEVDLIVLSSRGTGDAESYLLGSVSHKVTSMAKCAVLVI